MSARLLTWLLRATWYQMKELTGEADYDRYLKRHSLHRPGVATMSRGEYWQGRWEQEEQPGMRCC